MVPVGGLEFASGAPALNASCASCGAAAAVPEAGRRFPIQTADGLIVNGGPCSCGCERVRIRVVF